jgi:CheY-like chemotaxis protein
MHSPFEPLGNVPIALSGLTVLLVEDDPDGRELIALVLEQYGAAVTAVETAGAALEALEETSFDALVSDIGLPDQDGYALIAEVRSRPAEAGGTTPAIAITAYTDFESQTRALTAGFQAFVAKPAEPGELAGVIAIIARQIETSRQLLETLTAHAHVQRSLLDKLSRLLADRERIGAESRRLRDEARRLRERRAG